MRQRPARAMPCAYPSTITAGSRVVVMPVCDSALYRLRGLTTGQRETVTRKALVYFGMKFGWGKLVTHVLDGLINKIARREVFFFRQLNHSDRYPICSWITAFAYDSAIQYRFGVPPQCADPDQMHDWVEANPKEWALIFRYAM
ncbi:MAG: hypothetical protein ABI670_20320 [Chloroflexota bacterium]